MSITSYLVGGAVRDALLDLPVSERDWVVVGATADEMLGAGFRQADPDFPVFLHPDTGEEYALARRETKAGPGYRGFEIEAGPEVTLAQDLVRRDLTINAMARDGDGRLIDPYGGRKDLEAGLLRHVSDAFVEDPVRLLRVARFAARLGHLGFRVAHATHGLMKQMVEAGAVAELQPQRIRQEMIKAMAAPQPWRFFEVLNACGALRELAPALARVMGASGHGDRPAGDPVSALKAATRLSDDPELRLTAFLLGAPDAVEELRSRLGLPKRVVERLTAARSLWPMVQAMDTLTPVELEALLRDMGAWQQGARFDELRLIFGAQPGTPEGISRFPALREAGRSVDIAALRSRGLQGAALGQAISAARVEAVQAARSPG